MWFEELVGFPEGSVPESRGADVRARLRIEGEEMVSTVNGRRMRCGSLELASLDELRRRTAGLGGGSAQLSLREVVGNAGWLHRDERNAGAVFQAASQFNLLEMVAPEVTPEAGIAGYENDATQGPACAVACGAGTILRNYFVEVNGRIGQSADNQIDCLADVGVHLFGAGAGAGDGDGNGDAGPAWTMRNGYAMFDAAGLERVDDRLASMSAAELDEVRARLRVGVHHDVEVTTAPSGHVVTQVYCSALPVAYNRLPSEAFERFARLVLEAAYEATLRAAALATARSGNPTVFLTMLGGGVFGNDTAWIIDAIDRACTMAADLPLDVAIVSFRSSSPAVAELVGR
ncbi:MAG: hypothetical protein ACE367_03460 [Acidimicrobiales bacterium]